MGNLGGAAAGFSENGENYDGSNGTAHQEELAEDHTSGQGENKVRPSLNI